MAKETFTKGYGNYAGKNRVWEAVGRLKGLVEFEVKVAHEELEKDWAKTLAKQALLVEQYAKDKVAGKAHLWSWEPKVEWVDPYYDGGKKELFECYAKVRVVELPVPKKGKKFVLVYGDTDNAKVTSGTGPFRSQEEAWMWFLKGGR